MRGAYLQKEFATRLVAKVGSEDYGWLTVLRLNKPKLNF
jgi:16S rRNA A1518/A1519 N6-dimethyltransferase RsmA/KsgA/DIM1 with predicted DNA glycosylase/AP lyase activity